MLKNFNKKGFTLVELLVTIILLGIVGAIVIYNMTGVTRTSKETEYERYVAAVKSAAQVYADMNPNAFNDLYVSKAFIYITAEDLIKEGLIEEDLTNPYTEKAIGLDELIKANLDSTTGAVVFDYPVENEEEETFLVTISDYVVWGEPYDCMRGAGSYELALSEENGELIMLNDETIKQYNFECSMPSNFADYIDPTTKELVGKSTQAAGSYDITYSWVTSSGTRKTTTRTLRVLPMVQPTFKTNFEYDLTLNEDALWYTPQYNAESKEWTYLTYTAYIEGADPETTTFYITKKSNNPNGERENVTDGYTSTYETYQVDDGDKNYYIDTIVVGHHYKNYSYKASGQATMKSKLIIPPALITGGSKIWSTTKEFAISDTYSPVGVVKYEYHLADKDSVPVNDNDPTGVINDNLFDRTAQVTMKDIDILNSNCINDSTQFEHIYFRAINEDGFVGDWTPYIDAYLTNQLDLLIQADSVNCTNGEKCCLPTDTKGNCSYTNKVKYVNFGGRKFIILERDSKGKLLVAYEGVSFNRVTPTKLNSAKWSVQTCDGLFSKNYQYTSPVLQVIIDEGNAFLRALPTNYSNFIEMYNWPGGYNSFIGTVDRTWYLKYQKLLNTTNQPYWTTTTYSSGFTIYVDTPFAHGESTTAYNTYFYAVANGNLSVEYAGQNAYVKPLMKFKTVYVCGGDGTAASPYVIATK